MPKIRDLGINVIPISDPSRDEREMFACGTTPPKCAPPSKPQCKPNSAPKPKPKKYGNALPDAAVAQLKAQLQNEIGI